MPNTKKNITYAPWKNDGDWKRRNIVAAMSIAKQAGLNLDEKDAIAKYPGKTKRCADEIPVLVPYLGEDNKDVVRLLGELTATRIREDVGLEAEFRMSRSVRKRCIETLEVKTLTPGFYWRLVTLNPFPKNFSIWEAEEHLEGTTSYLAGPEILMLIAVDSLVLSRCVLGGYRINPLKNTAVELNVRTQFADENDENSALQQLILLESSNAVSERQQAPMPIARPATVKR